MIHPTPEDVDVVSRQLAGAIVAHNDEYEKHCMKDAK